VTKIFVADFSSFRKRTNKQGRFQLQGYLQQEGKIKLANEDSSFASFTFFFYQVRSRAEILTFFYPGLSAPRDQNENSGEPTRAFVLY
jgi:hypothetical protein